MNNKLLSFVLGLAIIGAMTSLHLYKSSSSLPKVSWTSDDLSFQSFLPDAKELAYRVSLFKDWAEVNNKSYSALEAPLRFRVWNKNYDFVQDHNAKNLSWTVEMNKFADLSTEEFSALYLGFRPNEDMVREHEASIEILEEEDDESVEASSVDWRKKGAVGAIRNQGNCGCCWAFSSAGALEGARKVLKKKSLVILSPQNLLDCSRNDGNNGCNGGTMVASFKYTQSHGIAKDSDYPYQQKQNSCRNPSSFFKNAGYKSVGASYKQLEAAVKKQPVAVAVEADQSAFQMYKSGVISSGCGTNLDHAILAVGYTSGHWIVKNQWGANWGNNGYVYIKKGSGNVCGINSMASYPTV